MPKSWKTVAVVTCPTGEILLNSVKIEEKFVSRTVCVFPDDESPVFGTMMQPLDELIADSQCQLQENTSKDPKGPDTGDKNHRREWWSKRERIDNELDLLSRTVERKFFSSSCVQALLFDDSDEVTNSVSSDCDDPEIRSTHCDVESPLKGSSDLRVLKVENLRKELVQLGMPMSDLWKMRKAELIECLIESRQRDDLKLSSQKTSETLSGISGNKYLLLLLDEDLHRFPVEALPCLRNRVVCRSPCIAFVAAKLLELNQDGRDTDKIYVEPKHSSYIIDPECNLMATRDRMSDFLSGESSKHATDWSHLVGEIPSKDFFNENLVREESMFLFFGHGGGQAYFSRSDVENLVQPGKRSIKASIVLMGCSSGQLLSVNRKKLHVPRKVTLLYEPEGLAQSYFTAGAPCVVGNLWDVTDREIDRFSIDMLSRFYSGRDLAESLMRARSVCKMRFLNGHAPVYYGVPVFPKRTARNPVSEVL
jgi:separase